MPAVHHRDTFEWGWGTPKFKKKTHTQGHVFPWCFFSCGDLRPKNATAIKAH